MTVLPVPTVAVANVAAAALHEMPAGFPVTVQLVRVAAVVPSYGLSAAVMLGLTGKAVMLARVVAVVLLKV